MSANKAATNVSMRSQFSMQTVMEYCTKFCSPINQKSGRHLFSTTIFCSRFLKMLLCNACVAFYIELRTVYFYLDAINSKARNLYKNLHIVKIQVRSCCLCIF
jgi:hypothetical protein